MGTLHRRQARVLYEYPSARRLMLLVMSTCSLEVRNLDIVTRG
jgi:hypothetical protein